MLAIKMSKRLTFFYFCANVRRYIEMFSPKIGLSALGGTPVPSDSDKFKKRKGITMETLITSGQKKQLSRLVGDSTEDFLDRLSIGKDAAQNVLGRGDELRTRAQKALAEIIGELSSDSIAEWKRFYLDYFDLNVDLSGVKIPVWQKGLDRIIVLAQRLTYGAVINVMRKKFNVWTYADDLDKAIDKNDRWPNESYAIRIRDRVEADEELKNISAEDLAKRGITGITCLERLIYELKYFSETGGHLDVQSVTMCSGSRDSDGDVPNVCFKDGWVDVSWYFLSGSVDSLRSRFAAV